MLAVPVGVDETARERTYYVNALHAADNAASGPW
jgi:hypothetical protein